MATGETQPSLDHHHRRWLHIRKMLERSGPFCHPDFEPSAEILDFIMNSCKILIVGAGGLGCELLKNLALMGFRKIHVIDMDTIELSNLNRQFLFRKKDIGSSKAECAAKFVNNRVPGVEVVPHHTAIQELDENFYRQFHLVVCGLDSIVARRWINGMLISLLRFNDDGTLDQATLIPLIDGGTEGFKGNARVVLPGLNACIECTLSLYPPQRTYPLCTIANTPRLPEHCIEYAKVIQWPRENPWGSTVPLDGDDPRHVSWLLEKAQERASKHNITGLTYRLAQGVIKNIVPAVPSTNAVIAASCATEAFKLATSCCVNLNNYMIFNDSDGIYTYTYEAEKRPDCLACGPPSQPHNLPCPDLQTATLQKLIDILKEHPDYQMKSPGLTSMVNGRNKTLYMSAVTSIEERTRDNLKKTLADLGMQNGSEIMVADITTPNTVTFILKPEGSCDVDMSL